MIKYNYTGAAALWDRLYTLCFNPWDLDDIQKDRRFFMRDITRGKTSETICYILETIDFSAVPPVANETLEKIKELEQLANDVITFKGVLV